MREIVWTELVHTTFWEQYLSQYCSYKKDLNMRANTIVIISSSIGGTISAIWKIVFDGEAVMWVSITVFATMLFSQLAALYQRNIYMSREKEEKIRKLRVMYLNYRNEVELLWIDIQSFNIDEQEARKRYYELRKEVAPIESLKDELNIKEKKGPYRRGNIQAYIRLHRKFGSDIPKMKKGNFFLRFFDKIVNLFGNSRS